MSSEAAAAPDLLALARRAIRQRLDGGSAALPRTPGRPSQGCFVSLTRRGTGALRGCVGTIRPEWPTLEEEVAANALAAALRDPRFAPVGPGELDALRLSLALLSEPEPVAGPEALDPARYGLIVRAGGRQGLLLPALAGVDSVSRQLAVCRKKAGIAAGEPVSLERFTVERLEE